MDKCEALLEQETRKKYSGETGAYKPETISHLPDAQSKNFSQNLLCFKFELVRRVSKGAILLDVGCGNGLHATELAKSAKEVHGVDYSPAFIEYAKDVAAKDGRSNVYFYCDNARTLPFASDTFDVAYCFAALYYMPAPLDVLSEVARVLKTGATCVLEFGNSNSLNSIVCAHYPELATICHIPVKEMKRIVLESGLVVRQHFSFQLLPMWADRPRWLWPLLQPVWNRIMSIRVKEKMLDEWISSSRPFRRFAFRHILVCEKLHKL